MPRTLPLNTTLASSVRVLPASTPVLNTCQCEWGYVFQIEVQNWSFALRRSRGVYGSIWFYGLVFSVKPPQCLRHYVQEESVLHSSLTQLHLHLLCSNNSPEALFLCIPLYEFSGTILLSRQLHTTYRGILPRAIPRSSNTLCNAFCTSLYLSIRSLDVKAASTAPLPASFPVGLKGTILSLIPSCGRLASSLYDSTSSVPHLSAQVLELKWSVCYSEIISCPDISSTLLLYISILLCPCPTSYLFHNIISQQRGKCSTVVVLFRSISVM